jgi:hypothetical protein
LLCTHSALGTFGTKNGLCLFRFQVSDFPLELKTGFFLFGSRFSTAPWN